MKSSDRYKICSQCEGKIPVEVVICPYCSSSLSNEGSTKSLSAHKTAGENLANLYNPPYASQRPNPTSAMEEKKKEFGIAPKAEAKAATMDKSAEKPEKSEILPVSLLVVGSNLLVVGLMQLFLSDDGILNLEWNSHFWYVYSLAALPLIWFGVKSLKSSSH